MWAEARPWLALAIGHLVVRAHVGWTVLAIWQTVYIRACHALVLVVQSYGNKHHDDHEQLQRVGHIARLTTLTSTEHQAAGRRRLSTFSSEHANVLVIDANGRKK